MTRKDAHKFLDAAFSDAEKTEFVKKPLAYALYKVWKMADAEDRKSDKKAEAGI